MSPVCETTQTSAENSLLQAIGQTPLLRLSQIEQSLEGVELYAKAEWFNPGGSVKDRPAARMICEAISSGQLTGERRILDATSGNTGIAYAMIAGLVARMLTMPTGVLAETTVLERAAASAVALLVYFRVTERNLFAGVAAGAAAIWLLQRAGG